MTEMYIVIFPNFMRKKKEEGEEKNKKKQKEIKKQ